LLLPTFLREFFVPVGVPYKSDGELGKGVGSGVGGGSSCTSMLLFTPSSLGCKIGSIGIGRFFLSVTNGSGDWILFDDDGVQLTFK
jgi:hypothetical protein